MVKGGWQQKRLLKEDVISALLEGFVSGTDVLVLTQAL